MVDRNCGRNTEKEHEKTRTKGVRLSLSQDLVPLLQMDTGATSSRERQPALYMLCEIVPDTARNSRTCAAATYTSPTYFTR
jgi:hypothetical protein